MPKYGVPRGRQRRLGDRRKYVMRGREVKTVDCDSDWDELEIPDFQMEDDGIAW